MSWLQVVPLAALVSAVVTLTIRWLDRPRPVLSIQSQLVNSEHQKVWRSQDLFGCPLIVTNSGDGDAFDLRVYGSLCDVAQHAPKSHPGGHDSWRNRIPSLPAGEQLILECVMPMADAMNAELIITWASPLRPQLRRKRFRSKIYDLGTETFFPPGLIGVREIPKRASEAVLDQNSPRSGLIRRDTTMFPDFGESGERG
ncbi:hypothetical protein IU501_27080 [Nocardia otitidiscaviarum]|uniref:hypothetical protein n=1 Tax=Nocardia otitidiscaviarum TaxID=1823 RepID=UPI0011DD8BC3|nr:hypothetical protein [Nocardia otitidiscaviarum]MBF6136644.1 hypothetical protein [Nocardia otitidiscaviarum]MBF6484847.1 hypothetical protein [Nocardia otitidiscaviarum]